MTTITARAEFISTYPGFTTGLEGLPQGVSFSSAPFATEAEADAFIATLPKSWKFYRVHVTAQDRSVHWRAHCRTINLAPNGVNGEKNETGIKRYRAITAGLAKRGVDTDWTTGYANSYETREAFEAAI